jgi:hypothetical protein
MTNQNEGNELVKLLKRLTPENLAHIDALAPPGSSTPPDQATRLVVLRRVVRAGLERMEREATPPSSTA